jgi:hypothetical protein
MRSPKSRILQLKKEIAELDQKLITSNTLKQDTSPLQNISNKKDQDRDEIFQKITSSRISASGKSENLQSQLLKIQTKLKTLFSKKQAEVNSTRDAREKILYEINTQNNSLQQLYNEFQSISGSIYKKQKLKEEISLAKSKAYENSLIPLEKEAEKLLNDKESLMKEQYRMQEELLMYENIELMCREDMLSRYTQRAEYIGQREEVEVMLEALHINHADLLEYLTEEDINQPKPSYIKYTAQGLADSTPYIDNNHTQYKDQISVIEKSIENNAALITNLERKYDKIILEIDELLSDSSGTKSNSEILKIEKIINEKSLEFDIDTLENVILDLNALEGFDIDEEILRLQFEEVTKSENKLKYEFEYEEKRLLDDLACSARDGKGTSELQNELDFKRNQYRNRFGAISQWKEEVEGVISRNLSNVKVLVQDKTIIEEYSASLGKVNGNSSKQAIRNLIDNYLAKVIVRDKAIQAKIPDIKKKFIEKSHFFQMLIQAQEEKSKLQTEKIKLNLEISQKTPKFSTKMLKKPEKSNPIKQQAISLKTLQKNLQKSIQTQGKLYENISTTLKEVIQYLKNVKKSLGSIRYSINKISTDELTIHFQIEKTLENKRKDMILSLQERSSNTKEIEEMKLGQIKEQIDQATLGIESLNKELSRLDSENLVNLAAIDQEESLLKTQQQIIESAIRNLDLENKLKRGAGPRYKK